MLLLKTSKFKKGIMEKYRITKYDPRKRDSEGRYLDNSDWTSISDIGRVGFEDFTFLEYKKVESKYVEAIKIILTEKEVNKLKIDSIEKYSPNDSFEDLKNNFSSLENDLELDLMEIENLIRLILREQVWMNLISSKVEVNFGYDYYMYVKCEELKLSSIRKIQAIGLFIEGE